VFPDGDSTDDSIMYISLYTPEKAETDSARRHWDRNMALLLATVENEDFPLSEGSSAACIRERRTQSFSAAMSRPCSTSTSL
jgi:hypothetical protein